VCYNIKFREKQMNQLIKFIAILFILSSLELYAQNANGKITGTVVDKVTKQPALAASVVVEGTIYGATTDENGNYTIISIPPGTYHVKASIVGYKPVTKTDVIVTNIKPAQVDFELTEAVQQLSGITVKSDYFNKDPNNISSVRSFGYEEIRRAPGGFEDVIRALSVLPGVAQADAGRNDLIVRGGAPSENLYVVDGIEVPNINHFGSQGATGGPLSYINLDFVKETTFSTGGFSSIYGDKLSSVLKIDLRDSRKDKIGGKATISASQFGLDLEGPVSSNSNFLFSARRSYLDFIFKAAGFGFVPEYYDALAKYNFHPDQNNAISYIFIGAFDNVKFFNNTQDQRFDNSRVLGSDQTQYVTGITYRHLFNNGLFRIILSRNYVDYNTVQRDSLLNPVFLNKSKEAENRIKAEVVYKMSSNNEINLGVDFKYIKSTADILFPFFRTTFGDTLPVNSLYTDDRYQKFSAYINHNMLWFERLRTNLGLRFDYFNPLDKSSYFSPRFSASYSIDELTDINLSAGLYYQSPSYIWLAVGNNRKTLKDIKAVQYIAGIDRKLSDAAILKIEGYYKKYSDYPASLIRPYLVLANTGAGFAGSDDNYSSFGLEPLASLGKGFARGVELSVQKKFSNEPYYGIASLTYNQSKYAAIDGIERTGSYDQTWIFNISGGYKFNDYWEASMKFRYSTAKPYTPFNPDGTQNIADYNTLRTSPNNSLDVRVDKRWFFESWTLITYIDLQNIYNNKNTSGVRWNARERKAENSSSIGLLPSIGISAEF
jgi:hypothetical protein